jgi:hypothetical protein
MSPSESPQSFLSEAVRTKIIKDLAGKESGWIYFVVMIASGYLIFQFVGNKSLHLLWALLIGGLAGSQWEEFRKKKFAAMDDQMLQLLHNEFQGKRAVSRLLTGLGVAAVVGFLAIGYFSNRSNGDTTTAGADCAVEQVEVEPFVFVLNDQPDAGFVVKTRVSNAGAATSIRISARLSTSEGDFEKGTTRHFEKQSAQAVRIDFSEPTANAANVQAMVNCR